MMWFVLSLTLQYRPFFCVFLFGQSYPGQKKTRVLHLLTTPLLITFMCLVATMVTTLTFDLECICHVLLSVIPYLQLALNLVNCRCISTQCIICRCFQHFFAVLQYGVNYGLHLIYFSKFSRWVILKVDALIFIIGGIS